MKLLERQAPLDQLRRHLADAAEGRGQLVSVLGEAGVGKTALARMFADGVGNGVRVLWGACEDLSTPEPLGPLRDLARAAKRSLPGAFDGATSRLTTFSQALEILDDGTTLVVIEDLHWADDATTDFVRYLGRRIRDTHILLLVTARDDDADAQARLRRTLVDIPVVNRTRIDVPRLSQAAVSALAQDAGREVADLFATTAGNAFFVTEALRSANKELMPSTVRDAVLQRAGRLSDRARHVLDVAAIFPRRVEFVVLSAICGTDAASGIEECIAAGMLQVVGDGYAYRHEIARRTIEATLSLARRRELNGRALEALRGVDQVAVARLAHHAHEAEDSGAVRELAPKAAQEAARVGAHREAASHYATALAHASAFAIDERAALYEKSAFEHYLIGRVDEAIRAREAALALRRAGGDALNEGDGLRWLSRLHYMAGDQTSANHFAREAVDLLETLSPSAELAMAYSNVAQLAMLAEDGRAISWGEKAIILSEKLGRPDILSHALNNVGTSKQWLDAAAARADLKRSLQLALDHDYPEHAARAYTNLACLEVTVRDNPRAYTLLEVGIAYCAERDIDTLRDYMRGWLAELLSREGRWDEAAQAALSVVANESATPLVRNPAVLALARVRMRRGDPEVTPLLHELAAFMEKGMEAPRFAAYAVLVAEHAWLVQAETATVLSLLQQAAAMVAKTGSPWLIGEIEYWRRKLVPGSDAAELEGAATPYRLLFAGDWLAAAKAWAELHAPYEQALALLEGDEDAQRRALDVLDTIGVAAAAERVRAELHQHGVRNIARGPRASTRANAAGLTRRQMDVLGLIDRGFSNAEIGEKLFVSPKTIDHHVSAILAKLEARSRGEAAAIARSEGLIIGES